MTAENTYEVGIAESAMRIDFIELNFNQGEIIRFSDQESAYDFKDYLDRVSKDYTPYLQPSGGTSDETLATNPAEYGD